jgi:dihydroorotate dehydrogenase electron transfer subunit
MTARSAAAPPNPVSPSSCRVRVLENRPRALDLYEIVLLAPSGWGPARAGQFVQLDCPPRSQFGFRRPFSLAGCRAQADGVELRIVYGVVGTRTQALARVEAGEELGLLGPLGQPFRPVAGRRPVGIGGGRGIGPILMLARQWTEVPAGDRAGAPESAGLLLYGARTVNLFYPIEEAPWDLRLATDDGSFGFAGNLVELLDALVAEGRVDPARDALYACGPNVLLAALARWSEARGCPCQVSLETHFGCGFGICAGCAVPVREGAAHGAGGEGAMSGPGSARDAFDRYVFACREGPVFEAGRVEWEGVAE